MKSKAQIAAEQFAIRAKEAGFNFAATGGIVRIFKKLTPGSLEEFRNADMDYGYVLDAAPLKGGSVWGTDGGGIGGMVAMQTGHFCMNKSGNGSAFLKALARIAQ